MIRVALCLSGLTGGDSDEKDGAGAALDLEVPFEHYNQHILSKNDVDVFIHSWSVEQAAGLRKLYEPVRSAFEPQIHFSDQFREHIIRSRWYSQWQAIELKRQHEIESHFIYDLVMIARLDLLWFTDIHFGDYDPEYFYVSNWNHNGPNKIGPYNRSIYYLETGFLDLWFFSCSPNMDWFGQLYNFLDSLLTKKSMSNHRLSKAWVDQLDLSVKYVFWRGFDHEIYRRWKRPGWHTE